MHIITKINAVQPALASLLVPDPLQGCWNNTWNNNEVLNRLTQVSVQVQIHGCDVCLWQAFCTIWLQNTLADGWPVIPQHCSSSYGSSCCNYCADWFCFVPCHGLCQTRTTAVQCKCTNACVLTAVLQSLWEMTGSCVSPIFYLWVHCLSGMWRVCTGFQQRDMRFGQVFCTHITKK